MTLATGNALAKVRKNQDGKWVLVEGETQHIFEVADPGYMLGFFSDSGSKYLRPTLRVIE